MKEFHCLEGCSSCCGPVPFPKQVWEKFKKLAEKPDYLMEDSIAVFPVSKNMECVFLSNHKCLIYEDRPSICKDYGLIKELPCPFLKPNGNKRSLAQTTKIQRQIENRYKEFKKEAGFK